MWFDSDFSFSKHVRNVCKSCFIQLRDFRNIRQFLTHDSAVSVANAFVSSRLDYCNSVFRSLSKFNLHRVQSIQKSAARIVTNSSKYTRITPVFRKLHWLPVHFCSEFKLATLVYKFIHTGFPKYFAPDLFMYHNTYNKHSDACIYLPPYKLDVLKIVEYKFSCEIEAHVEVTTSLMFDCNTFKHKRHLLILVAITLPSK